MESLKHLFQRKHASFSILSTLCSCHLGTSRMVIPTKMLFNLNIKQVKKTVNMHYNSYLPHSENNLSMNHILFFESPNYTLSEGNCKHCYDESTFEGYLPVIRRIASSNFESMILKEDPWSDHVIAFLLAGSSSIS